MSKFIGCSFHIQQSAAANLYRKCYTLILKAAAYWLQPAVINFDVFPYSPMNDTHSFTVDSYFPIVGTHSYNVGTYSPIHDTYFPILVLTPHCHLSLPFPACLSLPFPPLPCLPLAALPCPSLTASRCPSRPVLFPALP